MYFDKKGKIKPDFEGVSSSRDFIHAHEALVIRYLKLQILFRQNFPNKNLLVTCTYRSPEEQRRLYMQGRNGNPGPIITNCDGFNKKSNHNYQPSRAIDVAVTNGGKALWDEAEYYPLVTLAKQVGLISGGSWEKFQDFPHLELPKDVT